MAGKKRKLSCKTPSKLKKVKIQNDTASENYTLESINTSTELFLKTTEEEFSINTNLINTSKTMNVISDENASVDALVSSESNEFVPIPWFLDNIVSLELSIKRNNVPFICGPVGCGKTAIVDYVSKKLGACTFRMQISEQTDTKALLGAYCCSTTPGIFIWRPGPLIHCMTSGKWLILEDVDKGSSDLPILLNPVLRHLKDSSSQVIHPNTGKPIARHPHFRLILTKRTTNSHGFTEQSVDSDIFAAHCSIVFMNCMNSEIIERIVELRFPALLPLAKRLLAEFPALQSMSSFTSFSHETQQQRPVSSRDFFKFCARASSQDRNVEETGAAQSLFLDALDCFVCSQPAGPARDKLAFLLGGIFNFTIEQSIELWRIRRPALYINQQMTRVEAGRASLPIKRSIQWELQLSNTSAEGNAFGGQIFADTRLACCLVERLGLAVSYREPVLLVGETGTGKTSSIQRLARMAGRRLRVLNLNQQSDSVDLLGGFKPVDTRALINPVREKFETLFVNTFKLETNRQFLGHIQTCAGAGRWRDLLTLMRHPSKAAIRKLSKETAIEKKKDGENKRPTVGEWTNLMTELNSLEEKMTTSQGLMFAFIEGALVRALAEGDWVLLDEINLAPAELLDCLAGLLDSATGSLTLVDRGDLEPVRRHPNFHLFAAMNPSTDVGKRDLPTGLRNRFTELQVEELDPVTCPADREDLTLLVRTYLIGLSPSVSQVTAIVQLYSAIKQAACGGLVDGVGQRPYFSLRTLCRALTEASRGYHGSFLRSIYEGFLFSFGSQVGRSSRPTLERLIQTSLIATVPGRTSDVAKDREALCRQLFGRPLPSPELKGTMSNEVVSSGPLSRFICIEGYWLPQGPEPVREVDAKVVADINYVLTSSVRANLKDLARVVSAAGSLPVLLQGETSVGKTSLITYLAGRVGQICHRINNHEHTDLQTYLGAYTASSATGTAISGGDTSSVQPLVFQEGIFVQAMKKGHWIILDELNLAPTEILEALNRVLDENRELFITETQEMVHAHPHFRVFATQNPPGLYAGRKILSRALRNRFVELHFDPLPRNELEIILEHRSALPPSRAKKLVQVMHQLQLMRRSSDVFQGKDGFITLRDLFRWGERYRLASCAGPTADGTSEDLFDWDTYLAEQGYILLAGRARNLDEAHMVADVLAKVFNRKVVEESLFDMHSETSMAAVEFLELTEKMTEQTEDDDKRPKKTKKAEDFSHIVWTRDMRRLLVLVGNALKYKEPVLLVGETGCGKTTICQIFSSLRNQQLHCVNCHQYTEASDFLGGLRPVRASNESDDDRLFEWVDGPLVEAMLSGDCFLLDEISLADDAVLERLNSILEPERRLCLAERCGDGGGNDETADIAATSNFRLLATMNPGGDYAKKELSPALRNRFTEIWCPSPLFNTKQELGLKDWRAIIEHNLLLRARSKCKLDELWKPMAAAMVDFCWWFAKERNDSIGSRSCRRPMPTVRDILAWVEFINSLASSQTAEHEKPLSSYFIACLHGASLLFLDSLEDQVGVNETEEATEHLFVDSSSIDQHLIILRQTQEKKQDQLKSYFSFTSTGGINYLLVSLLTRFHAVANLEGIDLMSEIHSAATRVLATCTLAPTIGFAGFAPTLVQANSLYGSDPFFIETGPIVTPDNVDSTNTSLPFSLSAATPASNMCRLLRALQLPQRALLLEGSPGVGKTSLVMALARASGHRVVRINLSEATEASDLFGCDLPVEGAGCGNFAWRDGPLLQALRQGHWILLDEMNLASQSVLECLNACLDHRGSIFIPELGQTFHVKPRATRLFACQNPVEEGGGRKALPKSFLNRFTQVYLKPLNVEDQQAILCSILPQIPINHVRAMVAFNLALQDAVEKRLFGASGGPWEFNLRDLCRWGDLMLNGQSTNGLNPGLYVYLLYAGRMRTDEDKQQVVDLWNQVAASVEDFDATINRAYLPQGRAVQLRLEKKLQVGLASWSPAVDEGSRRSSLEDPGLLLLHHHRAYLEMILTTLQMGWMSIVVGPRGSGKRSLVHLAAFLTQRKISTVALSPSADTVELLGAFEQREAGGIFSWIDSPLVKGIREGHWVMLENAQLCSPSVLDRLNSLMEPGGELMVSERGLDAEGNLVRLRPHPEFRLILTVDESSGSAAMSVTNISRAMRNRGVEIAITHDLTVSQEDLHRLLLSSDLPRTHVNAILNFDSSILIEVSRLMDNTFTDYDISFMPIRKPPIGALLSVGCMLQQLLASSTHSPLVWTKEERRLIEDTKSLSPSEVEAVLWLMPIGRISLSMEQRAYLKALQDVYVKRQSDKNIARAFNEAIVSFVKNSLPVLLLQTYDTQFHTLPLNNANDFFTEEGSIIPNLGYWLQCLKMTIGDRGDLINCHRLISERLLVSDEKCWTEEDCFNRLLSISHIFEKTNQMDVRWFPGWKSLSNNREDMIPIWNRFLVNAYFELLSVSFNLAIRSFEDTVMTTGQNQFNLPPHLPVLLAGQKLAAGDFPAAWSEPYPGLTAVQSDWEFALKLHREHLYNEQNSFTLFSRLLACTLRLTTWLRLFACLPIGSSIDWPERSEFHKRQARLLSLSAPLDRLMEVIHRYRLAPQPRCLFIESNAKRLDLTYVMWSKIAMTAQDQLSTVLERVSTIDEDDEYEIDVEMMDSNTTIRSGSTISARLWPMLVTAIVIASRSDRQRGKESSLGWNPAHTKEIILELGLGLGALCRPRLLKLLSSSSELRMSKWNGIKSLSDILQNHLTLITQTHDNPSEHESGAGLIKPDLTMEWRSLGQAVFTMTCNGNDNIVSLASGTIVCSFTDWKLHQETLFDLYHLQVSFSPPCITKSSYQVAFSEEFLQLISLSEGLIAAIQSGFEKLVANSSFAIAPMKGDSIGQCDESINFNDRVIQLAVRIHSLVEVLPTTAPVFLTHLLNLFLETWSQALIACDKSDSLNVLARLWILWGCLQLQCACPISPLDPSMVTAHKVAAAQMELDALNDDLRTRGAIRCTQYGVCGLPCSFNEDCPIPFNHRGCVDSVTYLSNVEAGLEHPLIGAIVKRREKIAAKLEKLKAIQVVTYDNAPMQMRSASNSLYAVLRRRLQTFATNFGETFLSEFWSTSFAGEKEVNSKTNTCLLRSATIAKWTEATSSLSEWLFQPEQLHHYADIVEPFLFGLTKVTHGLRLKVSDAVDSDPQVIAFVGLISTLSTGLFPNLGCSVQGKQKSESSMLSPYLELTRQLISPDLRVALRHLCQGPASDQIGASRSIFTDPKDAQANSIMVALRAVENDHRLTSHLLDLVLLDCLSNKKVEINNDNHRTTFISRLVKAITSPLLARWRRSEARKRREADRRSALFIEAEQKRRICLDQLQAACAVKEKKQVTGGTKAERRRRKKAAAEEAAATDDLPDLIDANLDEEVQWRLRFSEKGAIDAQKSLLRGSSGSATIFGMNLSRDDQIRQTVSEIASVNSWYSEQLARDAVGASDWIPPDTQLYSFIDRIVYLLHLLVPNSTQFSAQQDIVEQHWWNTFMHGYQFAGQLLATSPHQLPESLDAVSSASHLLSTARLAILSQGGAGDSEGGLFSFEPLLAKTNSFVRRRRCLDVYRDAIPTGEALKAQALIYKIHERVLQVLQEWPDHPALVKIITVIGRIGEFSMTDCLMKYITAFELLLTEMQEWEKNAARHVSLSEMFRAICDLLVDWRKMELKCWMAGLDASTQAAADRCAPLWFHLQAIFLQPTKPGKSLDSADVEERSRDQCQAMLEFMENGPIGEFYARWRLLTAVHCAIIIWPGLADEERNASKQAVGNVIWYYSQFVPHVNKFLLDQQKPIRKEMRSFISVMKWGDYMNFWTIKENVDRCKKTIHKHIRSWEEVLRQSVKPFFESYIKSNIEKPIAAASLATLDMLKSAISTPDFELPADLHQWLVDQSDVPVHVKRLPTLITCFRRHVTRMSTNSPCLVWIDQLRECLEEWMARIKELSKNTAQLDTDAPAHEHLVNLLLETEAHQYRPDKQKKIRETSRQQSEEETLKTKEWQSRFTALQQNKKLALIEWNRLACGRRQLNALHLPSEGAEVVNKSGVDFLSDVDEDGESDELCLGLSYRRGLRKSLFKKPRGHLLTSLYGSLWNFACVKSPVPSTDQLHSLLADNDFRTLQSVASQCLARLIALRSGLPDHPENPEVVDDLGGRDGVERLLGTLDDLLSNSVDAVKPISCLVDVCSSLGQRLAEITVSYISTKNENINDLRPCNKITMQRIKASRSRISELASQSVRQFSRFWETCSSVLSIKERASKPLQSLILDNENLLPLTNVPTALSSPMHCLTIYRERLEHLASQLDQHIPPSCFLITPEINRQQQVLETAAYELLACCQEIESKYRMPESQASVFSVLISMANSILSEVIESSQVIASAKFPSKATTPLDTRMNVFIGSVLVSLQSLQRIDSLEKNASMLEYLMDSTSNLTSKSVPKLEHVDAQLRRLLVLIPSESFDVQVAYMRCITPLVASLVAAVQIRLKQMWGLLFAWLSVGEFLSQVAFRLLNDGFCKPSALSKASAAVGGEGEASDSKEAGDGKEQEGDGGCTSLSAQGVDASGAKDVSDQLENQEQIEGTQNQQKTDRDEDEESPEDNDAQGIEMPDDFDGAFGDDNKNVDGEDNEKDQAENEEEENNDLNGIDEQMGDASDDPEEINNEMWASDDETEKDEEEEKEEDRNNADSKTGGVDDKKSKSKQSKSTAKDKSGREGDKNPHNEGDDVADDNDVDETANDMDKTETVAGKEQPDEQPRGSGQETVAGADKEDSAMQDKQEEEMKTDEANLAQKEAERMETEENEEGENNDNEAIDEFAENMDTQPNPEDFEDMGDNAQASDDEVNLKSQPMEVEGEDENLEELEVEETGPADPEKEKPEADLTSYQPGVGDLNSGHAISGLDQNQTSEEQQSDEANQNVSDQTGEASEQETEQKAGGASRESNKLSVGASASSNANNANQSETDQQKGRQRNQGPRPTSDDRIIDPSNLQKPMQQTKILESEVEPSPGTTAESEDIKESDVAQHIHKDDTDTTVTAFDSATDAQKQGVSEQMEDETDATPTEPGADPQQHVADEPPAEPVLETVPFAQQSGTTTMEQNQPDGDALAGNESRTLPKPDMQMIDTMGAQRAPESNFFTQALNVPEIIDVLAPMMPQPREYKLDREALRAAAVDWQACVSRSSMMSVQLCEALRLVLEPTRASRMKGDFRTGKRLNMRKIIPYLASQFRKDKIWMRRTQPSQRDYRILIAVDNSSSMADNLCKHMTFEALATVVSALNLLEAGKIGICGFGESVQVVHGIGEPWSNEIGAAILSQFNFNQTRTSLTELLLTSISMMQMAGEGSSSAGKVPASQLLLILSDGVFSEDPENPKLQAAVRMARDRRLFIVCIIIDDAKKKHSIFDLRRYAGPGRLTPYMDVFPLPYYLVLRDVTALPQLLADALRQWFELAAASPSVHA